MIFNLIRINFIVFLFSTAVICVNAQIDMPDASSPTNRSNQTKEDIPKNVKEKLAQNRIEREKKDYQELLDHSDEAFKLSGELQKSFTKQNKLTADDQKKVDRLEKLVKKIRKELGGDDMEDSDEQNPPDLNSAFEELQKNTSNLFDEVKQFTRYSISVDAIEYSNRLLYLLQFIRLGQK